MLVTQFKGFFDPPELCGAARCVYLIASRIPPGQVIWEERKRGRGEERTRGRGEEGKWGREDEGKRGRGEKGEEGTTWNFFNLLVFVALLFPTFPNRRKIKVEPRKQQKL